MKLKQQLQRIINPPTTEGFLLAAESGDTDYLDNYMKNPPRNSLHTQRVAEVALIAAVKCQKVAAVKCLMVQHGVSPIPVRTQETETLQSTWEGLSLKSPLIDDYAFGSKENAKDEAEKTGNEEIILMIKAHIDKNSGISPAGHTPKLS